MVRSYHSISIVLYGCFCAQNVKRFYQDANHGPTTKLQFEVMTSSFSFHSIDMNDDLWICTPEQLNDKV